MKLSDVLANLRARLRDDNAALTKTGDSFLTSLVYFWQNQILAEFELNLCEICVNLDEKDEIELPFEILRVVAIYLNNEPLKLTTTRCRLFYKRMVLPSFIKGRLFGSLSYLRIRSLACRVRLMPYSCSSALGFKKSLLVFGTLVCSRKALLFRFWLSIMLSFFENFR